jgi:hypothetical protein
LSHSRAKVPQIVVGIGSNPLLIVEHVLPEPV